MTKTIIIRDIFLLSVKNETQGSETALRILFYVAPGKKYRAIKIFIHAKYLLYYNAHSM